MSLPRSVQAQLEAAEAMLADVNKPAEAATQPDSVHADVAPTEAAPQVEPSSEPPAKPTDTPVAEAVKSDESTWEQRYKSLQGLFNSRVNELQVSNKALTQQVHELTTRLDRLMNELSKRPEPPTAVADPKDVEEFGQDLVEMVKRQASAVFAGLAAKVDGVVQAFETRLAAVEQQLNGTAQTVSMTAEEVFFSKLSQAVPDWEQINADQRFLDWLGEEDPVYGVSRQAALTAAHKALDVKRVAAIFNTFKALHQSQKSTKSVEKQVSPATTAAPAPTAQPEKPVITQAQIQAFYRDVAQNKYRGREAEAAKLEQVINEAIAEGRVR